MGWRTSVLILAVSVGLMGISPRLKSKRDDVKELFITMKALSENEVHLEILHRRTWLFNLQQDLSSMAFTLQYWDHMPINAKARDVFVWQTKALLVDTEKYPEFTGLMSQDVERLQSMVIAKDPVSDIEPVLLGISLDAQEISSRFKDAESYFVDDGYEFWENLGAGWELIQDVLRDVENKWCD